MNGVSDEEKVRRREVQQLGGRPGDSIVTTTGGRKILQRSIETSSRGGSREVFIDPGTGNEIQIQQREVQRGEGGGFTQFVERNPPAPTSAAPAAPSGPTAAQRAAERAAAESQARAAAQRAAAARADLTERQRQRAEARDDRPLTRGGSAVTRRPASTAVADDAVDAANLLGAAVTRLEERQRDLTSTRRGRGSLFGTG